MSHELLDERYVKAIKRENSLTSATFTGLYVSCACIALTSAGHPSPFFSPTSHTSELHRPSSILKLADNQLQHAQYRVTRPARPGRGIARATVGPAGRTDRAVVWPAPRPLHRPDCHGDRLGCRADQPWRCVCPHSALRLRSDNSTSLKRVPDRWTLAGRQVAPERSVPAVPLCRADVGNRDHDEDLQLARLAADGRLCRRFRWVRSGHPVSTRPARNAMGRLERGLWVEKGEIGRSQSGRCDREDSTLVSVLVQAMHHSRMWPRRSPCFAQRRAVGWGEETSVGLL